MKASDIMNLGVATVTADASLAEAARIMLNHRIRSLPVLEEDGTIVGVLTETDLMRVIEKDPSWISAVAGKRPTHPAIMEATRAADVMSRNVTTIDENAPAADAIPLFCDQSLHHIPVLRDGKVRGMLSPTDILRAIFETR